MMQDRLILQRAAETMNSAVRFLNQVIDWLVKDGELTFGGITVGAAVEELRTAKPGLIDILEKCSVFIADEWPKIENNKLRMGEVERFLGEYEKFRDKIIEYDDAVIEFPSKAEELLDQYLQSQEYIIVVVRFDKEFDLARHHAKETISKVATRNLWDSFAEDLYQHFCWGLNGSQLENLILHHELPITKGTWNGEKKDATYFGKRCGLACWEMNEAFEFHRDDDKNICIKLDYHKNHDTKVNEESIIAKILDRVGIDFREKGK